MAMARRVGVFCMVGQRQRVTNGGNMNFYCTFCGMMHEGSACPQTDEASSRPYACPVCNGQKIVSKPPWIAGDINEWAGSGTDTYECPACNGTGIVWK